MENSSVRVLIAEDNDVDALIIERVLMRSGFKVVRVTNGQLAFDTCKSQQFDLIITDLFMPGMTGIEFLTQLRADKKIFRAIVLTASKEDETVIKSMNLGADVIQKPINPHIFLAKVQNVLKQQPI
jgi:two-component system, OmpR family, alkaline phosphatase synthesis response regulator PhoP